MFRIWPTTTADALVSDSAAGKIVGFVTFHCIASNHAKPGWKCTELVIVGATTSYYSVLVCKSSGDMREHTIVDCHATKVSTRGIANNRDIDEATILRLEV
jgi:hypothetical protein